MSPPCQRICFHVYPWRAKISFNLSLNFLFWRQKRESCVFIWNFIIFKKNFPELFFSFFAGCSVLGEARMGCCWGLNALISEITLSLISSSEDSSMYLDLNRGSNKDDNFNSVTVPLPIYRGLINVIFYCFFHRCYQVCVIFTLFQQCVI